MPDFALAASDDPLGLASAVIQLVDVTGGPVKDYSETLGDNAKWIAAANKVLRPREEGSCSYELLDTASLVVAFGAAVNTNYIITSMSASMSSTARPTVQVGWMKPSAIAKLKAYGTSMSVTIGGGFGVVSTLGCTIAGTPAAAAVSASLSIEMQTADAGLGSDADYIAAGLYYYGFKKVCQLTAYGAITLPAGGKSTAEETALGRDGWKTFSKSWYEYMDPIT
jgi:hypothetical protein